MAGVLADRRLTPELLDHLPQGDPQAVWSRRDLVHINAVMFQAAIMAARLRRDVPRPPLRILEIGCGDGAFMLAVLKRMHRQWPGGELILLDQQDLIPADRRVRFADLGWRVETVQADALSWMERSAGGYDLVTANLFLHHFDAARLGRLLSETARLAPAFVATEPRRNGIALAATALLRAIGANRVTRHDAAASVRAGFTAAELSRLWPATGSVTLHEGAIGPFTHVFSAVATP